MTKNYFLSFLLIVRKPILQNVKYISSKAIRLAALRNKDVTDAFKPFFLCGEKF